MDECENWHVYMLRASDNSLYCGATNDIFRRFKEHQKNGSKTAKYLRGKQPLTLVWHCSNLTKKQALSLEWKIKQLSKKKKELICQGVVCI